MKRRNYELPFRWNIQQRTSLGSLLEGPQEDMPEPQADWYPPAGRPFPVPSNALYEITVECARIVALSQNADLCFVGRSLESLFDYLSGLLSATSWAERLLLLHFSWYQDTQVQQRELLGLRHYFEHVELDPAHLVHRERPVAFVDVVVSGSTFGNLVNFLWEWSKESGEDWEAVRKKILLIGLTRRVTTSPNTLRWQQHVAWRKLLPPQAVKNVAIPPGLWGYFGNSQLKTTPSYTHYRWGRSEAAQPDHRRERLFALRLAVQFYDWGQQKQWRQTFALDLSREKAMVYPWFRALLHEVKR